MAGRAILPEGPALPMPFTLQLIRSGARWCLQQPLGRSQWLVLVLWLSALAITMITLGDYIAQTTNRDLEQFDQGAYLRVAEQNRDSWWPAGTDGVRNPLYP